MSNYTMFSVARPSHLNHLQICLWVRWSDGGFLAESVFIPAPFVRELICIGLPGGELDHRDPLLSMIHVEMSQWKIHLLILTYFCHYHARCTYLLNAICSLPKTFGLFAALTPLFIDSFQYHRFCF